MRETEKGREGGRKQVYGEWVLTLLQEEVAAAVSLSVGYPSHQSYR